MVIWRLGLAAAVLAGCQLDRATLYRCEADKTCAQAGATCAPDGYCYPEGVTGPAWPEVDAGCMPSVRNCRDVGATCGFVETGCRPLFCGTCFEGTECGTEQPNTCGRPHVCERGFCWENPLPQGNDINDVYALDERHVWMITDSSVLFWNGERTDVVPTPFEEGVTWEAIDGTGPTNIFVAGSRGRVMFFDGQQWVVERVAALDVTFRSVAVTGPSTAVATRNNELFIRYAGSNRTGGWTRLGSVPGNGGVFATASDAGIFLVNDQGELWQLKDGFNKLAPEQDGAVLRNVMLIGSSLYALLSYGPNDNKRIRVARYDLAAMPGQWESLYDAPLGENPRRFHTLDGRRFWVVYDGALDAVDRLDMQPSGQLERTDVFEDSSDPELRSRYNRVVGFASGRAMATGVGGSMAFLSNPDAGGLFRSAAQPRSTVEQFEGLCVGADGWLGAVSHANGFYQQSPLEPGRWARATLPANSATLSACVMGPGPRRWVFGESNTVVTFASEGATAVPTAILDQYDHRSATLAPTSSSVAVLGIGPSSPAVFVSPSGAGYDWVQTSAPPDVSGIAWSSSGIHVAGGGAGLIARLEPDGGWTPLRRGSRLESIRALVQDGGVTTLLAAGQRGTLVRQRDDGGFASVPAGIDDFVDLWPAPSGEVFLVGGRSNAPRLTAVLPTGEVVVEPLPLLSVPRAIVGRDLPDGPTVWVAGANGAILRRASPDGG